MGECSVWSGRPPDCTRLQVGRFSWHIRQDNFYITHYTHPSKLLDHTTLTLCCQLTSSLSLGVPVRCILSVTTILSCRVSEWPSGDQSFRLIHTQTFVLPSEDCRSGVQLRNYNFYYRHKLKKMCFNVCKSLVWYISQSRHIRTKADIWTSPHTQHTVKWPDRILFSDSS
jgi:hypothetical protein